MRISDWSSDVCSSDLFRRRPGAGDRDGRADRLSANARHTRRCRKGGAAGTSARPRCRFRSGAMTYDEVRHFADSWGLIVMVAMRSEEHTSELQSLMRISYAVFCLKKKKTTNKQQQHTNTTYTQ